MKYLILSFVFALSLTACSEAKKEDAGFKEGVHYAVIPGQSKPSATDELEITEIFWYGCNHCAAFEPILEPWKAALPSDIKFTPSPGIWSSQKGEVNPMYIHAKLYYAAQHLGALDVLHKVFFDAIHKDEKKLIKAAEINELVTSHGLDGGKLVSIMNAPKIEEQVKQASLRLKTYMITGTPEMVVGGYYHVSARRAGGQQQMLDVVDFLVNKIRTDKNSSESVTTEK